MDRLGDSLRKAHDKQKGKFSFKTTVKVGIQLISVLEELHQLGYIYNDLKPDNILIGKQPLRALRKCTKVDKFNELRHEFSSIKLVDFGLITPYVSEDGSHVQELAN